MIFGRKTGLREEHSVAFFAEFPKAEVWKGVVLWKGGQNKPVNGS